MVKDKVVPKKSVTPKQQSIDSQGVSAIADGVKKISSPEEKTSSSKKVVTDSKSVKNPSSKNTTGLPVGNENKERSHRDPSDSNKSHSNSSKEEGEIVIEGKHPSYDLHTTTQLFL
jgi:hypothetical protein